jgi:APA family basic amino acid/polyamine antiporter
METRWFLYGWSFFAVIQTGTIAAVGVALLSLRTYFQLLVIKISCLYEIGDFNLNAAQVVSISPSFYSVILIVVGSGSKTLKRFNSD